MMTITAITSRMWINPATDVHDEKPSIHRMNRITAIVQSMMASSQEVRYTWRDQELSLRLAHSRPAAARYAGTSLEHYGNQHACTPKVAPVQNNSLCGSTS